MNLMAWSDQFASGIDSIDAQHRALVDMINAAAPHLVSGGTQARQQVGPLLDKLTHYAATHFKYEEDLMQQLHVAPKYFAQHFQTHASFVDEVLLMRQQYDEGTELSGTDLLHFLTSWLTFHILSEDKRLAKQVLAIQAGDSPTRAYTALTTPEGAPQAVYTAALIDLFGLLTARNRTLSEANAQVRSAKLELEAANTLLEQRVTARTHELASVNATLESERQALEASLKRLEETQSQLLQSEKMAAVGQLAAGVAHEINNPIGFVTSNLVSLATYADRLFQLIDAYESLCQPLQAEQKIRLDAVRQQIEIDYLRQDIPDLLQESSDGLARVKRIVNDLRDFSLADDTQWGEADLNAALEIALKGVVSTLKTPPQLVRQFNTLPPVHCNVAQISQVFVNLLRNAVQATDAHGSILLRTGAHANSVWIEVTDTGCGMTEEVQKRIFEPFYTSKPVGQGTGLGLSMSWDIVKRHHGTISVSSQPGVGSTFRINLPHSTSLHA